MSAFTHLSAVTSAVLHKTKRCTTVDGAGLADNRILDGPKCKCILSFLCISSSKLSVVDCRGASFRDLPTRVAP